MKAMTKQELANSAGVSIRTFSHWCEPYREELLRMDWQPKMILLPPHIVKFLSDKFCIDVP